MTKKLFQSAYRRCSTDHCPHLNDQIINFLGLVVSFAISVIFVILFSFGNLSTYNRFFLQCWTPLPCAYRLPDTLVLCYALHTVRRGTLIGMWSNWVHRQVISAHSRTPGMHPCPLYGHNSYSSQRCCVEFLWNWLHDNWCSCCLLMDNGVWCTVTRLKENIWVIV